MNPLVVIGLCLFLALGIAASVYAFNECGWAMLAYKDPFIAALTGQCK